MIRFSRISAPLYVVLISWTSWAAASDRPSVEDLLKQLDNAETERRFDAAQSLGERGTKAQAAVGALTKLLSDKHVDVRAAAARSLGQIGASAKPAVPALLAMFEDNEQTREGQPVWHIAGEAIGQMGPETVPQLIPMLTHPSNATRFAAATAIHGIGPQAKEAVPTLLEELKKNHPQTRIAMMYGLMGIRSDSAPAAPTLLEMLDSTDFHTQYWSCRTLGSIGLPAAKAAVPKLVALLKHTTPSVRGNAAAALGNLGPDVGQDIVAPLTVTLTDKLYNVRRASAIALGQMGPTAKEAVPKLKECVANPNFAARCQAAVALYQITNDIEPTVKVLLEELDNRDAPWDAADGFQQIGQPAAVAMDRLIQMLSAKNSETRVFVASSLASFGPTAKPAIPRLKELLRDPDQDVRAVAAEAIELIEVPPTP